MEDVGRATEQEELSVSKSEYVYATNRLKEKFPGFVRCSLLDSMNLHSNFCDAYRGKHLVVSSVKCFLEATNPYIDPSYINFYYRYGNFVKNEGIPLVVTPDSCLKCIAYFSCYGGCPKLYPRDKDGFTTEQGREWCQLQKETFVRKAIMELEEENVVRVSKNRYGIERMVFLGK